MLPHLFFFFFQFFLLYEILFPIVPMVLLLFAEPNRAFVLLSAPVTCSLAGSLTLYLSLSLSLPLPPSPHLPVFFSSQADNWSPGGDSHVCFGERCKKGGAETKEQVWRRDSPHLNACLLVVFWLTLSVWSLEFSFQFLSSDVRKMVHCKPGSITR